MARLAEPTVSWEVLLLLKPPHEALPRSVVGAGFSPAGVSLRALEVSLPATVVSGSSVPAEGPGRVSGIPPRLFLV